MSGTQNSQTSSNFEKSGPITSLSEKAFDTFDESMNAVKDQSEKMLESKKVTAVHYLKDYAIAVKEAAVSLQELKHGEASPYLQKTSDKLAQLAQFLQNKSVKSMADDVLGFARKNPTLFVAGSMLAGLCLARFAKSTAQQPQQSLNEAHSDAQVQSLVNALDTSVNRQLDTATKA